MRTVTIGDKTLKAIRDLVNYCDLCVDHGDLAHTPKSDHIYLSLLEVDHALLDGESPESVVREASKNYSEDVAEKMIAAVTT